MTKNILLIYSTISYNVPNTFLEHLYSFRKYSDNKIFYLNFFYCKPLFLLKRIEFDLVIFHHSFAVTTNIHRLNRNINLLKRFLENDVLKVAFFQDECWYTDFYNRFINELNINIVFSVAPETEWDNIYNQVDREKVKFFRVLTGYIDDFIMQKLNKLGEKTEKKIDIFYRTVYNKPFYLGKFGNLKFKIAEYFQKLSKFEINISTKQQDLITGIKWYKYLLSSKYTIGVESGASLLDRDGSVINKVLNYLKYKPDADFEEVEFNCFKNLDGNINLRAISPRHFEACFTKTCQILIEGEYNGILKPWVHYIPLKKDLSNIDEIVAIIEKDNLRQKIVEQAYKDIVLSGNYYYSKFVEYVFYCIKLPQSNLKINFSDKIWHWVFKNIDGFNWILAYFFSKTIVIYFNFLSKNNFLNGLIMRLRKSLRF